MADATWQMKTALIMQAADAYARAYLKWHSEEPEQGDHERMRAARAALYSVVTDSVTSGVDLPDGGQRG